MTDDPFMKYNLGAVQRRTIDTLIGIGKGIVADSVVNQMEAEALLSWLAANVETVTKDPITYRLLVRLDEMLWDDVLDEEEAKELHDLLVGLSGGASMGGELSKSALSPLDDPPPAVIFDGRSFLFTGQFLFGRRHKCHEAVHAKGGKTLSNVTRMLDYLVIGYYVTPSWQHESFGGKIVKAMQYRDGRKSSLAIIGEEHWVKEGNLSAA